jgi:hypothetical protein
MDTPPPPPPPPPPAPPPPPPAAAQKNNKTLIIVLCVIGAILLIIGGCVTTCAFVVRKKAMEYSQDAQKNPTYAALSLAASVSPNIQIVSKDPNTGKMTLRNKKTGEVVTINTNDFTPENIGRAFEQLSKGVKPVVESSESTDEPAEPAVARATKSRMTPAAEPAEEAPAAEPEQPAAPKISAGKAAAMAATAKRFPAYVSPYPSGQTTEAIMQSFGPATIGSYEFLTSDGTDAVSSYYEKRFTAAGLTIGANNSGSNDNGATATLVATTADNLGTVTLNAETQSGGKVKVTIGFTSAKP